MIAILADQRKTTTQKNEVASTENSSKKTTLNLLNLHQFVIMLQITFQNKADGENNSRSWFLNPNTLSEDFSDHQMYCPHEYEPLREHMKDAAASHLQRARIICLFLHLSLPVFTVSS